GWLWLNGLLAATIVERSSTMQTGVNDMTTTTDILAADTAMGAVTLKVANLDRMIGYYSQGVGLSLLAQEGDSAILGRPGKPSLVLELAPELQHASQNAAGLFHT